MAERSPIFSTKIDNQKIGYIGGREAFDLLGNKRCNYNPSTGNLLELGSGRTIGHVSLAGYFVGSSWIAGELFPQLGAKNAPTTSPDKPSTADSTCLVSSPDTTMTVEFTALVTSPDKPLTTDPIASATSLDETKVVASTAQNSCSHEPSSAGPAAPFKAFSQESIAVEPAAPLTTSLEDTAAADSIVPATSSGSVVPATSSDKAAVALPTETPQSIDVEQQVLEMIRMTLAMKSIQPERQTVKELAMRMREHLAGLRRQRPRAGTVKMADFRGLRQNRPNGLRS
jgi:hypothetical protein